LSTWLTILAISLAGGLGACSRFFIDYLISELLRKGFFPLGTFIVNVSGSFFLGLLAGTAAYELMSPETFDIIAFGFLGSYTTFSTWMYESAHLMQKKRRYMAVSYIFFSIIAGVVAASAGLWLAV